MTMCIHKHTELCGAAFDVIVTGQEVESLTKHARLAISAQQWTDCEQKNGIWYIYAGVKMQNPQNQL